MEVLKNSAIPPDGKFTLSKQCQEAFCRFILSRTGIIIQEHQGESLCSAVVSACRRFGYTHADEYLNKLEHGAHPPHELDYLISAITVRESYFFRDQYQIDFIKDTWLPGLTARKRESGERSLRIWSAGCSSGQEIYTVAIVLKETMHDVRDWDITLLGTDINAGILPEAASGVYKDWSFRSTPEHILSKYFVRTGTEFTIRPDIREMVKFKYLNLIDGDFPFNLEPACLFDMILCRNVFIYLDPGIVKGILRKFVSLLSPDGVLILGASDLVEPDISGLELRYHQNMFYYQRSQMVSESQRHECAPRARLAEVEWQPKKAKPPVVVPKKKASAVSPALQKQQTPHEEAVMLDRKGLWHKIPEFVDAYSALHGEDAFLVGLKAKALASLGNLAASAELCNHSIELDKTCKYCYYIQATIFIEMGKNEDAQNALRKAIYLDHNFFEAHFHLGQLLVRLRNHKAGLKSLRNALELVERADPESFLFLEQELTCGQLAQILRSEIGFYEGR